MDNGIRTAKLDENANELAKSFADADGIVTYRRVEPPPSAAWREATVIINGVELSSAESATLRCAINSFQTHMATPFPLGNDDHGVAMTQAYREHAQKIVGLIHSMGGIG